MKIDPIIEALQFLQAERQCREHAAFSTAGLMAAKQLSAINRVLDPDMRAFMHELRDLFRAHHEPVAPDGAVPWSGRPDEAAAGKVPLRDQDA